MSEIDEIVGTKPTDTTPEQTVGSNLEVLKEIEKMALNDK